MAQVYFVKTTTDKKEALALLVKRMHQAVARGMKVAVLVRDEAAAEKLCEKMWEKEERTFVPHVVASVGSGLESIVIVAGHVPPRPATFIVNLGDTAVDLALAHPECRVVDPVFAGGSPGEKDLGEKIGRAKWAAYKAAGVRIQVKEGLE